MSQSPDNFAAPENARRKLLITIMLLVVPVLVGLGFLLLRSSSKSDAPVTLEGAVRPGSPEFDRALDRIVVDFDPDQNASEGARPVGDIVMTMTPKIRNFTGKTITGLELNCKVVDLDEKTVKERTLIVIPRGNKTEIDNNGVVETPFSIEGFSKTDVRANIRIKITGVKFKEQ